VLRSVEIALVPVYTRNNYWRATKTSASVLRRAEDADRRPRLTDLATC